MVQQLSAMFRAHDNCHLLALSSSLYTCMPKPGNWRTNLFQWAWECFAVFLVCLLGNWSSTILCKEAENKITWCIFELFFYTDHSIIYHIFFIYHPDRGLYKLYIVPDPKDQTDAQWDHPPFHQNSCWTCSNVILSFWKTRPTIYRDNMFFGFRLWTYLTLFAHGKAAVALKNCET